MSERDDRHPTPLDELLAERALFGVAGSETWQLAHLLEEAGREDERIVSTFDEIVADVDLALARASDEALPPELAAKILADAPAHLAAGPVEASTAVPRRPERRAWSASPWSGWLVAAAALVVALVGWWPRLAPLPGAPGRAEPDGPASAALESSARPAQDSVAAPEPRTPERATLADPADAPLVAAQERKIEASPPEAAVPLGPRERRAQLLDEASDARVVAWSPTEDLVALTASGDVVWSQERQEGYMRFRGLPTNNPASYQYQLWIFDAERDDRFPVDGGVFDIDVHGDEVVVPIDARLPVDRATLFAVTLEEPGGVVVSSRERLVLLASVN